MKFFARICILFALCLALCACCCHPTDGRTVQVVNPAADSSGFVLLSEAVPDAILEIRYYSTYNFVGDRIDGYEQPVALLTREAAFALRQVSDELVQKGYRLKIYDAYRPQMAVSHFMRWALDFEDTRMKPYFYPELEKDVLFPLGYIAEHSGHSRGSTVDLTLFDMATEKEVDMGGTFDYFGELSHPDYTGITEEQFANRMLLREAMLAHGFKPLAEEWWHFTLAEEPYPDTYFTFPVSAASVWPLFESPALAPSAEVFAERYWAVLAGLETGTAGASLKTAAAAEKLCAFAVENEMWNPDTEALRVHLLAAFEGMSAEEQAAAQAGFDAVRALLDACLEDWEAQRGLFEDAGAAEAMDEILGDPLNRLAWENLRNHTLTMGNAPDAR
ncbi:MAG: M15 family metallopeptidase [Clostridia bacterium]|nr:M15 family metallopeptidase [Clostridia bacterium]